MTKRKFRVEIGAPSRVIVFKNRSMRTPVELIVWESDLELLRLRLNLEQIVDYTITLLGEETEVLTTPVLQIHENVITEPTVEELENSEPKSTLEKLLK